MIPFIKCPYCQKYVEIKESQGEHEVSEHSIIEGDWIVICPLSNLPAIPRSKQTEI